MTGDIYIGQTERTLRERAGKNYNGYARCVRFYHALQKYGTEIFNSWIFEIVDTQEQANQSEIFWIEETRRLLGVEHVYNITDGGEISSGMRGKQHTELTKQKMSATRKGKKGEPMSDATKQKISQKRKGTSHSTETKARMSEQRQGPNNPNYGKTFSEEIKLRMSQAHRGRVAHNKGRPASEEQKRKQSTKMKGKMAGDKHPNFGKTLSDDTKQKISQAKRKLTPEQILEIKDSADSRESLAQKYNVSRGTINNIINHY